MFGIEYARLSRVLVGLWILLCAVDATAQSQPATLLGTVTDESGSAIENVAIEVHNVATGFVRVVVSGTDGSYRVPLLPVGEYLLQAQKDGFRAMERSGIVLAADATVRVDLRLLVGTLTDAVTVTAGAAPFDTETSRLNLTVSSRKAVDLPTNTVSPLGLGRLVPGAFARQEGHWSVAGLSSGQFAITYDGINANADNGVGAADGFVSSFDGIQDAQYTVTSQSAENSFASTVAFVTKSGTNQFSGTLSAYFSDPDWNGRNYFATTDPTGRLGGRGGGTLGGPVVRNRTFFFADVTGSRTTSLQQYNLLVPTDKLRNGDLSGLSAVRDPLTGQPFAGNRIPADRIPQVVRNMMAFYLPEPNVPRDDHFGFYNETVGVPSTSQKYRLRLDHRLSDSTNLTGSVYRGQVTTGLRQSIPVWGAAWMHSPARQESVGISSVLSSHLLNEARVARVVALTDRRSGDFDGASAVSQLGLLGYIAALPTGGAVPSLSISGATGVGAPSLNDRQDHTVQVMDTLTWTAGRHTVKAGAALRDTYQRWLLPDPNAMFGSLSFSGTFSGLGMSDFLLGLPQTTARSNRSDDTLRNAKQVHWFVQDDVRISDRLTLNLGVRFEHNPNASERNLGLISIFDHATGSVVVPTEAQLALVDPRIRATVPVVLAQDLGYDPDNLIDQRNRHWYPRVGLAWRPFGDVRTVLRAAYGLYASDQAIGGGGVGGAVYASTETFTNTIGPNGPLFQLPQMFPTGSATTPIAPGALTMDTQQYRRPVPYVQEWNVGFEREVTPSTSVRISYQASRTLNNAAVGNINQPRASTAPFAQSRRPYPLYGAINMREYRGSTFFNGVTVAASRRLSRGVLFDVAYSVQRMIADSYFFQPAGWNEDYYDIARDKGNEPFVPRHRFTAQAIWELPFGHDRHFGNSWRGPMEWVAGGWQVSSIFTAQSGLWFTPTFSGIDTSNTNRFGGRADAIGDGKLDNPTIQRWFDASAYAIPANGTFGNAKINSLSGPGRWVMDLGLFKTFGSWAGTQRFRVEATFINVFNRAAFGLPNTDIRSPTVGQITSTDGTEGGNGRTVQFGLRYTF